MGHNVTREVTCDKFGGVKTIIKEVCSVGFDAILKRQIEETHCDLWIDLSNELQVSTKHP